MKASLKLDYTVSRFDEFIFCSNLEHVIRACDLWLNLEPISLLVSGSNDSVICTDFYLFCILLLFIC